MMTLPLILADASPDTLISGNWITAFVVAVIGSVTSGILAWKKGEAKGRSEKITLTEPMPEIPTRRVYSPPTFYQHQELMRRVDALEKGTTAHREYVEGQFRAIRRENSEQFITLMNAGETRKDAIMEEVRTEMNRIYERINKLADQLK
jgi:hypothetical protein